jgi:hypothetical protein
MHPRFHCHPEVLVGDGKLNHIARRLGTLHAKHIGSYGDGLELRHHRSIISSLDGNGRKMREAFGFYEEVQIDRPIQ